MDKPIEDVKQDWTSFMIACVSDDNELDLPDKVLIRDQVGKFIDDYVKTNGCTPKLRADNIDAFSDDYLSLFGYYDFVKEDYRRDLKKQLEYTKKKVH